MPEEIKILKQKAKVKALSKFARESAKASSLKANLDIKCFKKNESGVPVPLNDIYWSVSHKLDFTAGIVSKQKVGIDIEYIKEVKESETAKTITTTTGKTKKIKNISENLFQKIVDKDEQLVFKNYDRHIAFFRAFTAKEAVLKLTGDGIKGLSKTKIKIIINSKDLIVQYLNKKYLVENFYFDNYLAAVTKDEQNNVKWTLL